MNKRTKATSISQSVKKKVFERDNFQCIYCGSNLGQPNAHFVSRAYGGLGIEENIITLCARCHYRMDNTIHRVDMKKYVKSYLQKHYPNWNEEELKYKKGINE